MFRQERVTTPQEEIMKTLLSTIVATVSVCAVGCASTPMGTRLDPVGPDPRQAVQGTATGFVQVYSAWQPAPLNTELEDYVAKTQFSPEDGSLKNDFLYTEAHDPYCIYSLDNRLLKQVVNARGLNDSHPARVELPAGSYLVEADTLEYDNFLHPVLIPVQIKPGLVTEVHLDGGGSFAAAKHSEIVTFPNGAVVGWHAQDGDKRNDSVPKSGGS